MSDNKNNITSALMVALQKFGYTFKYAASKLLYVQRAAFSSEYVLNEFFNLMNSCECCKRLNEINDNLFLLLEFTTSDKKTFLYAVQTDKIISQIFIYKLEKIFIDDYNVGKHIVASSVFSSGIPRDQKIKFVELENRNEKLKFFQNFFVERFNIKIEENVISADWINYNIEFILNNILFENIINSLGYPFNQLEVTHTNLLTSAIFF